MSDQSTLAGNKLNLGEDRKSTSSELSAILSLWMWIIDSNTKNISNMYVFEVPRKQKGLIMDTSLQLDFSHYTHALLHKYICSPMWL